MWYSITFHHYFPTYTSIIKCLIIFFLFFKLLKELPLFPWLSLLHSALAPLTTLPVLSLLINIFHFVTFWLYNSTSKQFPWSLNTLPFSHFLSLSLSLLSPPLIIVLSELNFNMKPKLLSWATLCCSLLGTPSDSYHRLLQQYTPTISPPSPFAYPFCMPFDTHLCAFSGRPLGLML